MLNYIWAGLIALSLVFALVADIADLRHDTYRNGQPLPISIVFTKGYDPVARRLPIEVRGDSAAVSAHFGQPVSMAPRYSGELIQSDTAPRSISRRTRPFRSRWPRSAA